MLLDELKLTIEKQTGVPASLLTGETAEENIVQAKAFLAYKRNAEQEAEARRTKSAKEAFADWMNAGEAKSDPTGEALARIEEQVRIEAGGYPIVKDGGSVNVQIGDGRSAKERFAAYAADALAFNPFKDKDGWTPLF